MKRLRFVALVGSFLAAAGCLDAQSDLPVPTVEKLSAKLDRLIAVIDNEPFLNSLADTEVGAKMSEDGTTMWHEGMIHLVPGDHPFANTAPWGPSYAALVSFGTDERTAAAALQRWHDVVKKSLPLTFAELPVQSAPGGHYRTIFYRSGEYPLIVTLGQDAAGGSRFPKEYNDAGTWRVTIELKIAGEWEKKLITYYDEHPNLKPDDTISRMTTIKLTLAALLEKRNDGFEKYRGAEFGKDEKGHPRYIAKGTVFPGRPAPLETITVENQGMVVYQALFGGPMMTSMLAVCYEDALTPAMKADGYEVTKSGEGLKMTYAIKQHGEVVSKYAVDKGNSAILVIIGIKE